jgi:hypothetical protein
MAERRMFAKSIIDSDAFLEMPQSTQLLYFHLSMRADDDGFINQPKAIMRMCCAKDDDIKILIAKKFIIPFENGVVVIKHWRIHNYIQKDRYKETNYKELKDSLFLDENGAYSQNEQVYTPCIQNGNTGKDSIGKYSKDNINNGKTIPPTLDMVKAYCKEMKYQTNPEDFFDFYESKGWYVGKNKMKDWHKSLSLWERNNHGVNAMFKKRNVVEMDWNNENTSSLTEDEEQEAKELANKLLGR